MNARQIKHFQTMAREIRRLVSDLWDEIDDASSPLLGEKLVATQDAITHLDSACAALEKAAHPSTSNGN